jgi:predicted dehydrogenase
MSWASKSWLHAFELTGAEGRLSWQPYDTGPVTLTLGRETQTLDLPPDENVHLPLVADFVAAVRDGRPPACPLAQAAQSTHLLAALYRSAEENRPVTVGP